VAAAAPQLVPTNDEKLTTKTTKTALEAVEAAAVDDDEKGDEWDVPRSSPSVKWWRRLWSPWRRAGVCDPPKCPRPARARRARHGQSRRTVKPRNATRRELPPAPAAEQTSLALAKAAVVVAAVEVAVPKEVAVEQVFASPRKCDDPWLPHHHHHVDVAVVPQHAKK